MTSAFLVKHHRKCDVSGDPDHSKLERLMIECSISGVALAQKCGVHVNTVSNWRTGRHDIPGAVFGYLELLAEVRRLGR